MYKTVLLVLFPILFLFACSESLEENIISTYPNGSPMKVEYFLKDNTSKEKVKEVRYGVSGEKEYEGYFKNNKKEGKWTTWYASGEKSSEYLYEEDMKQGEFTEWFENGEIKYQGFYEYNSPSGTWKFWNEDGELEREVTY